jgi:NAD(P)-dependent dehydrogenase (short-subunit alcohol dehydrogenase family)
MTTQKSRIFLVTGVSSGFGRALAEAALAEGHRVAGTVRREADRAAFEALAPGRAKGVVLDVTDTPAIAPAVAALETEFGPVDVLVNNAGYGHEGTVEESSLDELRSQFEVNVFGAVAMIKAVLPFMRQRRAGHIVNITSMGGIVTFPGLGFYHGSKFALEGLSEALGKEVKSFGVAVTAVEPGGFRTDWAGRSMVRAERSIADYDAVFEPLRARRQANSGKQPGDPAKAARAILTLVASAEPPAHLLLGRDAVGFVREKISALKAEIAAWEQVSLSTDFEG